jgi:hypothetical protein
MLALVLLYASGFFRFPYRYYWNTSPCPSLCRWLLVWRLSGGGQVPLCRFRQLLLVLCRRRCQSVVRAGQTFLRQLFICCQASGLGGEDLRDGSQARRSSVHVQAEDRWGSFYCHVNKYILRTEALPSFFMGFYSGTWSCETCMISNTADKLRQVVPIAYQIFCLLPDLCTNSDVTVFTDVRPARHLSQEPRYLSRPNPGNCFGCMPVHNRELRYRK